MSYTYIPPTIDDLAIYLSENGYSHPEDVTFINSPILGRYITGGITEDTGFVVDNGTPDEDAGTPSADAGLTDLPEDNAPSTWRVRIVHQAGKYEYVRAYRTGPHPADLLAAAIQDSDESVYKPHVFPIS